MAFEYTPPKNKKPVHLVKHMFQVPVKQRFAEPIWAQEKIDGVYAYGFMVPGFNNIYSRTGELCHSLKHLEAELAIAAARFKPSVAIFEVHRPGWPVNLISGAFRRESEQFTEAIARIHDVIPLDDFLAGRCEIPYRLRYVAADFVSQVLPTFTLIEAVEVCNEDEAYAFAKEKIDAGGEGGCYKRVNGIWIAGKKDVNSMKIKLERSDDLLVTGVYEGKEGTENEGKLGGLVARWRVGGKATGEVVTVRFRGCITDEQADEWWADPSKIIGKIVKVDSMCLTAKGMLREPRYKEVRDDKIEADF